MLVLIVQYPILEVLVVHSIQECWLLLLLLRIRTAKVESLSFVVTNRVRFRVIEGRGAREVVVIETRLGLLVRFDTVGKLVPESLGLLK